MPVGWKCVQHAGGLFRLAECSLASLPHLPTRDVGHPQFPGPQVFHPLGWAERPRIPPVGMTILLLGINSVPLHLFRPLQNCHSDRSGAQWRDLLFAFPVLAQALKHTTHLLGSKHAYRGEMKTTWRA